MARPINPYQGPAPAAMSQMGAGLLEAGANIGRTLQAGYESMGKGIAGGITSAASSIADYYKQNKEAQTRFDATKRMFKAFQSFLEPSQREEIQGIFDDTTISTAEKNQLAPLLMNYLGAAQTQQYAMQRGAQQESGATTRTKIGAQVNAYQYGGAPAPQTGGGQPQGDIVQPIDQNQLPQYGADGMPGTDMPGGTPLAPVDFSLPVSDKKFMPVKRKKPIAERFQSHMEIKY